MNAEATEPGRVQDCDVLIIGAGAAGFAAAVTAARKGLKVIVAEKASYFGGTSAASGGWVWVPGSAQARAAGVMDDIEKARTYLRDEMGQRYSTAHVDAYLHMAPQALEFFARESDLSFELGPLYAAITQRPPVASPVVAPWWPNPMTAASWAVRSAASSRLSPKLPSSGWQWGPVKISSISPM